ncbi:MAG: lysylphosphatidylglycerol synthase transmembrane domain-containing protein [Bacteroidia bacterium]
MNRVIVVVVSYVLPALLGFALIYATLKNISINQLIEALKNGNYIVIIPVLAISILVYILRVIRWQLLYKTVDVGVKKNVLFASLATGYAVNFVIPRFGEVIRALTIKKTDNIKINISLSTIVFERAIDTLCLAIITVSVFIAEYFYDGSLIKQFVSINDLNLSNKLFLALLAVVFAFLFWFVLKKQQFKALIWLKEFIQVFIKLLKVKRPLFFYLCTVGIWIGFFLMTYLWFDMFSESKNITLYEAYLIMFLGVVARSLPIQAGSAGAYHYVVSSALIFINIPNQIAVTLAFVIHGFQSLLTLVLGLGAYIWLLFIKKQNA